MRSDELWNFYAGSSLTLHIIGTDGELCNVKLGKNIDNEERFQSVVKLGSWLAASVDDVTSYLWLDVLFLLDSITRTGG
jgi:predicted cupin superfamily sugar epimerase